MLRPRWTVQRSILGRSAHARVISRIVAPAGAAVAATIARVARLPAFAESVGASTATALTIEDATCPGRCATADRWIEVVVITVPGAAVATAVTCCSAKTTRTHAVVASAAAAVAIREAVPVEALAAADVGAIHAPLAAAVAAARAGDAGRRALAHTLRTGMCIGAACATATGSTGADAAITDRIAAAGRRIAHLALAAGDEITDTAQGHTAIVRSIAVRARRAGIAGGIAAYPSTRPLGASAVFDALFSRQAVAVVDAWLPAGGERTAHPLADITSTRRGAALAGTTVGIRPADVGLGVGDWDTGLAVLIADVTDGAAI